MYLLLDLPPMTNIQVEQYIIEYNSSLDFVDDMSDAAKWTYYFGTENYLNLNDEQFEYLETVYYPIFEEELRQEEQQREIEEYRNYANENPNVVIDSDTPQEDVCHLGGGVVVKCSEFWK